LTAVGHEKGARANGSVCPDRRSEAETCGSLQCKFGKKICETPDFLDLVITGDESWIFQYDPQTKRQSMQWQTPSSPRLKKARMSRSKIKSMLVVLFDCRGVVHHEFVPPNQTVNQTLYIEILGRLREKFERHGPICGRTNGFCTMAMRRVIPPS